MAASDLNAWRWNNYVKVKVKVQFSAVAGALTQ